MFFIVGSQVTYLLTQRWDCRNIVLLKAIFTFFYLFTWGRAESRTTAIHTKKKMYETSLTHTWADQSPSMWTHCQLLWRRLLSGPSHTWQRSVTLMTIIKCPLSHLLFCEGSRLLTCALCCLPPFLPFISFDRIPAFTLPLASHGLTCRINGPGLGLELILDLCLRRAQTLFFWSEAQNRHKSSP